jgi:hypothetical protein
MKKELTKIKNELSNFIDTINDWEKTKQRNQMG